MGESIQAVFIQHKIICERNNSDSGTLMSLRKEG